MLNPSLLYACCCAQSVHSLDLVAVAPGVIACNMAHTPLESASCDVAVFRCVDLAVGGSFILCRWHAAPTPSLLMANVVVLPPVPPPQSSAFLAFKLKYASNLKTCINLASAVGVIAVWRSWGLITVPSWLRPHVC